jgi:DNA invertase Pin-like site-specific DNA recombinase
VLTDKASGQDVQRPQLATLRAFVRAGDSMVHSMDRLARNLDDVHQIIQQLNQRRRAAEEELFDLIGPGSPLSITIC